MKDKMSDIEELVSFARKNRLLKVETNLFKIELHPSSFQDALSKNVDIIKDELREEVKLQVQEESLKQQQKEMEEILYFSSGSKV